MTEAWLAFAWTQISASRLLPGRVTSELAPARQAVGDRKTLVSRFLQLQGERARAREKERGKGAHRYGDVSSLTCHGTMCVSYKTVTYISLME